MDFLNLPDFGGPVLTILAFILALSIIVAIHEYGHYIVGRWCGIHAEVFSLGFGPVLLSRVDRRGTVWQVAAFPLGGYVKFLGDANAASVGGTEVSAADKRRSMLGAPIWARSLTVVAGPVFNFILAGGIFAGVMMVEGFAADPLRVNNLDPLPASYVVELRPGDEILSVAGVTATTTDELRNALSVLPKEPSLPYQIRRDGEEIEVMAPWPYPPRVDALSPAGAAYDAGLRIDDTIIAIDGADIFRFDQIVEAVEAADGAPLELSVMRAGEVLTMTLEPRLADLPDGEGGFFQRWLIGVNGGPFFDPVTYTPGIVEAVERGTLQVWDILVSSTSGLYHMVAGSISSCNLSGPVGIMQAAGAMASQGGTSFIWFVAVLSAAIGLLNLFPVPILDGGHLVFHAYEAVRGRPPSEKVLNVLMIGGLSIILTMMLFALANDLFLCP